MVDPTIWNDSDDNGRRVSSLQNTNYNDRYTNLLDVYIFSRQVFLKWHVVSTRRLCYCHQTKSLRPWMFERPLASTTFNCNNYRVLSTRRIYFNERKWPLVGFVFRLCSKRKLFIVLKKSTHTIRSAPEHNSIDKKIFSIVTGYTKYTWMTNTYVLFLFSIVHISTL